MPPDDARHRTFICRDDLWAACERLAWQQGRSVDEVIGDALSRYVRGPASITPPPGGGGQMAMAPTLQAPGRAPSGYPTGRPPGSGGGPPPLPPTLTSSPYPPPQAPQQRGFPPPQPPNYPQQQGGYSGGGGGYPPPQAPGGYGQSGGYAAPQGFNQTSPLNQPPGPPRPAPGPAAGAEGPPTYPIFLYYQGDRVEIMQPRFVLGRSRNASDYAINDSNVSRQHAAVEWLRGHYHIVDLGSTNGIQFNGRRIERKVIYDGDVITIAGHQLRFGRQ